MSKCKMSFPLTAPADVFLDKARNAIGRAGGQLNGDASGGSFSIATPMGTVAGGYTVQNNELVIEITDKPMFIGCGMIESMLRSQLA